MSKRNALLVAVVAVLVLAVYFFWPERARADLAVSGRTGAGFGGAGIGARLHHGDAGVRGRVHAGQGARGGIYRGGRHGVGHRAVRHGRGPLIGDRFRLYGYDRIGGGKRAKGALLGDRFLAQQRRRLDAEFLGSDDRHDHQDRYGHDRYGRDWRGRDQHGHRRGRHHDKSLRRELLLPYGGADVIVREVIVLVDVPVPVPAARQRSAGIEARGRVVLVGEEDGIVGGWAPGDVLPDSVPHVTLDPVAYGLPEPPPGEKYARVGNDVLRIEAGSRRITEIVVR